MSDVKNCYNCSNEISVYVSECQYCGALHDPKKRPNRKKDIPKPNVEATQNVTTREFLRAVGFEQYEEAFEENQITADLLKTLSIDDLREIGISALGDRKKLMNAIQASAPNGPESESASAPKSQGQWLTRRPESSLPSSRRKPSRPTVDSVPERSSTNRKWVPGCAIFIVICLAICVCCGIFGGPVTCKSCLEDCEKIRDVMQKANCMDRCYNAFGVDRCIGN